MAIDLDVLKDTLINFKIRQCELAQRSNLSPGTVSQIISGWIVPGERRAWKLKTALETYNVDKVIINSMFRNYNFKK